MNGFEKRREDFFSKLMSQKYVFDVTTKEIDALTAALDLDMLRVMIDDGTEGAVEMIRAATKWFDIPHAEGSVPIDWNPDFLAIRLSWVLAEPLCYNKLPEDVKEGIRIFFTKKDHRSKFHSENHDLMFRATRYISAQEYPEEYFENYSMQGADMYEHDRKYLHDFLDFRAGQGWGEFDSDYTSHVMIILAGLHKYAKDETLRVKCHMAMDVILMDMITDSLGYYYAGAHGRTYPGAIIERHRIGMSGLYRYYFGDGYEKYGGAGRAMFYITDYVPSPIVYSVVKEKTENFHPYENRERKHLHSYNTWGGENIDWENLSQITGSISKYTYVCQDYAIGGINRQEDYPEGHRDAWYAHHQQQEWEFTLPDTAHKIFSHHMAISSGPDNRWTGDLYCCCGSFYTNKDTAIAMYNIDNMNESDIVNAYVPFDAFEEKLLEEKYIFLSYGKLYISLYVDNGYTVNDFDEFRNREIRSIGRQNALVLRVAYKSEYGSLSAFADAIKAMPVVFDREARVVSFDGITLERNGNGECGVRNVYPYPEVYKSPYMNSVWDSKVIEVTDGKSTVVYDFVNCCMR